MLLQMALFHSFLWLSNTECLLEKLTLDLPSWGIEPLNPQLATSLAFWLKKYSWARGAVREKAGLCPGQERHVVLGWRGKREGDTTFSKDFFRAYMPSSCWVMQSKRCGPDLKEVKSLQGYALDHEAGGQRFQTVYVWESNWSTVWLLHSGIALEFAFE